LLRRSPLRTARAAFTASSSSKPRGRRRVCRFLTAARSCSCSALKIRCRSCRTLSSWNRQRPPTRAPRPRVRSPSGVQLVLRYRRIRPRHIQRLTCPRRRPFRGPGTRPGIRPVIRDPTTWRSGHSRSRVPVGFRPPAFASWASCSRQRVPLSSRSAYRTARRRPDSVGVSVFRTHETRPGWVPSLPRGGGVLPTSAASLIGACRFTTASPLPRCNLPPAELLITEHTKIHSRSPVRPFPCPSFPGGTGTLRLSPGLRTPRSPTTHARAGTVHRTLDRITSSSSDDLQSA
jgi:hypothetical protein